MIPEKGRARAMGETFRAAFQGIWAHKLRSFLTMLGVIIGIAAIIGIVSTIKGTNEQIMQNLIGAGNNNVTVSLKQGNEEYYMEMGAPAGVLPVSEEQKSEILDLEGVEDASFYLSRTWSDPITRGDIALESASIRGIDTHYLNTTGYRVTEGRPFTERDFRRFMKVALLDETAAGKLFPEGGAVGSAIEIKSEPFIVTGIIHKDESNGPVIQSFQDYLNYAGDDNFGTVMIPSAIWPVVYSYDEPENCVAKAVSVDAMSDVGKQIETILNRGIASAADGMAGSLGEASMSDAEGEDASGEEASTESGSTRIQYKAVDLLEKARNKQELAASTNNLLIWVASIALLVGGIGVMNIMLVSVSERTNEIGLKKALGARKNRILAQFLTESALLTSIGGILGVIAGIILAQVIARMSETPVAISIPAIVLGVVFSMAIGIIFGLLPSIKAANLNPIDALRRE